VDYVLIVDLGARARRVPVKPDDTIQQARDCLRERFGAAWLAPYAPGKAEMANWLAERLALPHEAAVRIVEEMEREGMLRFEGVTGRTASPAAQDKVEPAPQSPLTPDVVVPEAALPSPEMGTWLIE
jgi:hypothetical protein